MSRKLRTIIPTSWRSLKPRTVNIKRHIQLRNQYKTRVKEYYDRNARPLPELEIGDLVYYKKSPQEVLRPARVEEVCKEPRSYIIRDGQNTYRRNRQHINLGSQTNEIGDTSEPNEADKETTENVISGEITTRSGRRVVHPDRLIYK